MNNFEIDKFSKTLKNDITKWLDTNEGKENPYSSDLSELPKLFDILTNIKVSTSPPFSVKNIELFSRKIDKTIDLIISPLDLLPEALLGPSGYIDDLYILCLCFKEILDDPESKIEELGVDPNFIKKVIANGEKMLGNNILDQAISIYKKY